MSRMLLFTSVFGKHSACFDIESQKVKNKMPKTEKYIQKTLDKAEKMGYNRVNEHPIMVLRLIRKKGIIQYGNL